MRLTTPIALALVSLAASCGGTETPPPAKTPTMPAEHWSATPLADAKDVIETRENAKDGDEVVLRGTLQDFGDLATFKLVEDTLDDCTEMGEPDHCETPWDYCCADPEALTKYTVNVEFLDGDLPAEWSLRGQHGLDRLTEVTVAGTLRIDDAGNMRLEATKVGPQ